MDREDLEPQENQSPPEGSPELYQDQPPQYSPDNPPADEPEPEPEQNQAENEPAAESQAADLGQIFAEINGGLDDVEKALSENFPGYTKARSMLGTDNVKLCEHYVLGTTSPAKPGKVDIGFLSSRVSPIKKLVDPSPPSAGRDPGADLEEDADRLGSEPIGENADEENPLPAAEPEKEYESDSKYRDAVLQQNFWGREQPKLSYRREEPIPTYKYQGPTAASAVTKPTLGILEKYKRKF